MHTPNAALRLPVAAALHDGRVIEVAERGVVLGFDVSAQYAHGLGVQGGVLAGLLDMAMAQAVAHLAGDGRLPRCLECKTSYLAGGTPGHLRARGTVLHAGGTIAFAEGTLEDAGGRRIARASATYRLQRLAAG